MTESPADRRQQRLRRAAHVVGLVALAVIVLPFVAFAVPQAVGATGSYVVVSESMNAEPAPVLAAGDVVFVYDTPPERVESGDVITYRSGGGEVTTHRVVEVVETGDGLAFETKGDANEEADREPVPAERLVGTVEFSIPAMGHIVVFAGTTRGTILLLIVPAALLVGGELVGIVRELRKPPEELPADEERT